MPKIDTLDETQGPASTIADIDPAQRPVITIAQTADLMGISRSAAYRAVRSGSIPSIPMSGNHRVVPTARLKALLGFDQVTR